MRCQRSIKGLAWHDFVSDEEVRTRIRSISLNETIQKLSLLQIARLRKEVPADQALWTAVDVRDGVVVMVVPEIRRFSELPLTR